MTIKDCEAFAKILAKAYRQVLIKYRGGVPQEGCMDIIDGITEDCSRFFQYDNPRFDPVKFKTFIQWIVEG